MHTHERPYLIVAATSMHLKMTAPDGKSFADRVRPGDFHWADSKVTHTLTNEGTAEGQIVEIELKESGHHSRGEVYRVGKPEMWFAQSLCAIAPG